MTRFNISDDQLDKVNVKDAKNTSDLFQSATILSISSLGHISYNYQSNMNTPYEVIVKNPDGDIIHTMQKNYIYKSARNYFETDDINNGNYTIEVTQDGIVTKGSFELDLS